METKLINKYFVVKLGECNYVIEKYDTKKKQYIQLPIHYVTEEEAEKEKLGLEAEEGTKLTNS